MTAPLTFEPKALASESQRLLADFTQPTPLHRPVPFWSWNERMDPAEVRRQVSLIADAGWGGAFMHSRVGLVTPYLGDAWFEAVDAAMDACRAHGIRAWLYDEDGWPSGFSGGSVPRADEAFRLVVLLARPVGEPAPARAAPLGEPVHGVQLYTWRAQLDDPRFNGACYTSLLNRGAVERFLEDAYDAYHRRYGADYGGLIPAAFTDEPSVIYRLRVPEGAAPFAEGLIERFEQLHGYDPRPLLHLLFVDASDAARFRLHYYRTVSDLFERHYVQALGRWCAKHGVALTGHLMAEHHLYEQHAWSVSVSPMYRHFDIPGVDHLGRQIEERLSAKQCQSGANQFGKRRVLSELYGMAGQGITFEDRHWIAAQQIALGVNLLNPHLSLYTMAGCRKRDYPPNLYYQQPWWPLNRVIDEPLSRLCAAMAHGRYLAEAVVLHPQDSVSALWRADAAPANGAALVPRSFTPTAAGVAEQVGAIDAQLKSVIDVLLNAQRTFDLGDEAILASHGGVEHADGQAWLRIGEMRYPAVVLPTCLTLRPTTFELLRRFHDAGGLVVRCGDAPRWIDGRPDATLDAWVATLPTVALDALPVVLGAPLVRFESDAPGGVELLFVHVRELEDGSRLLLAVNLDRFATRAGRLIVAGRWSSADWLNYWTGGVAALPARVDEAHTTLNLALAPGEARLLHLSHDATLASAVRYTGTTRESHVLDPAMWRVERLDDNALTLDMACWREGGGPWSQAAVPVVAIQRRLEAIDKRCDVRLRFVFHADETFRATGLRLVMEYPDRYDIRVNGRPVRYNGAEPWLDLRWLPIDIASVVRPGRNVVELRLRDWRPRPISDDAAKEAFVELEALYLVGDFAVSAVETTERPVCPAWSRNGLPPVRVRCFAGDAFRLAAPRPLAPGDTTTQGLPFYAGRLRIAVPLPAARCDDNDRWLLAVDAHDAAVAEVTIDGEAVGHFVAHPYEVDVTEAMRGGARAAHVTLYGTLRNLLGPHHHVEGELPAVTPHNFLPAFAATDDVPTLVAAWGEGVPRFADWTDRYAMVAFGGVQGLRLVREKTRPQRGT